MYRGVLEFAKIYITYIKPKFGFEELVNKLMILMIFRLAATE